MLMSDKNKEIEFSYTNWKGVTRDRHVRPDNIWFGTSQWHEGEQWFLTAYDFDKQANREFALVGITNIRTYNKAADNTVVQSITVAREVKLFTDGGSRGNPGPSAIGYVLLDMADQQIVVKSKYLGITTNNQAEYQGLIQGLEECRKLQVRQVHVHMDSLLVINQMKGIYKVKNRDLWPVYEAAKELTGAFKQVTFTHVPRELNKIADSMVNECLDTEID